MKKRNKIIALLLVLVMVTGVLAVAPIAVSAAANPYPSTQDIDDDGNYEVPCTRFAWQQVYDNFGIALPDWGHAVNWWNGAQNAGYATSSEPKAGAVAVWSGDCYGHVAYVISGSGNTFTVNEGGRTDLDHTSSHGIAYNYTLTNAVGGARPYDYGKTLLGFIYPDSSNQNTKMGIDYGDDFYGLVLNTAAWKPIGQDDNNNLVAMTGTSLNEHKIRWHFVKVNSNNGYRIFSTYNGRYWDVTNASGEPGANIQTYPYNDNPAQIWYFQYRDNKLTLTAGCTNCVVDFIYGLTEDGANIQTWAYNGTSSQTLSLYKFDDKCGINYGQEFYAVIRNTLTAKPIAQTENGNVELATETTDNYDKTIWRFTRENNINTYRISSIYNGKYLDVDGAVNADGINVHCWNYNDTSAQRWYIQKRRNCIALTAECTTRYLDLTGGKTIDGTNAQMYAFNNTEAQNFTIDILDSEQLDFIPIISSDKQAISVNSSTKVHVDNTKYAYNYKIHIVAPNGEETVMDNQCNSTYTFTPTQTGAYQIYAEVTNPFYVKSGLEENQIITILSCGTGDANLDGNINIKDTTALQRYLANLESFTDNQLALADTNGDGVVNINDATHLQRYLAEFDVNLG